MTKRRGMILGSTGITAVVAGVFLLMASPEVPAQIAPTPVQPLVSTISVTGYEVVSSRRISRTQFEYTYRVLVSNSGGPLKNVLLLAQSVVSSATITDGRVVVGFVPASTTSLRSIDTLTLRQDRAVPITAAALSWTAYGDAIQIDTAPVTVTSAEFSEFAGRAGHEGLMPTRANPLAGSVVPARIQLSSPPSTSTLQLVSESGSLISSAPLTPYIETDSVLTDFISSISVPTVPFRMQVNGIDAQSRDFSSTWPELFFPSTDSLRFAGGLVRVAPGGTQSVGLEVTNGGAPATFTLTLTTSFPGFTAEAVSPTVTLSTGETRTIPITVSAPSNYPGYTGFDVTATLTHPSNPLRALSATISGITDTVGH